MKLSELDCIIPYKRAFGDELKYCLRSLKNIPHRNVYIIGDLPDWATGIIHIPMDTRDPSRFIDVENIMRKVCHDDRISDDFILMNDDFYVMEKVTELPNWYSDTIDAEYQRRIKIDRNNRYAKGYKATDEYLKSLGVKEPLDYSLHIPIVMNKQKRMIVSHLRYNDLKNNKILLSRSIYCNLFCDKGTQHPDVKYIRIDDGFKKYAFMSTHDSSFINGKIGTYIRDKFKERGQYERD